MPGKAIWHHWTSNPPP